MTARIMSAAGIKAFSSSATLTLGPVRVFLPVIVCFNSMAGSWSAVEGPMPTYGPDIAEVMVREVVVPVGRMFGSVVSCQYVHTGGVKIYQAEKGSECEGGAIVQWCEGHCLSVQYMTACIATKNCA